MRGSNDAAGSDGAHGTRPRRPSGPTFSRLAAIFLGAAIAGGVPLVERTPSAAAADRPRARDLGIPFEGTPGPLNAVTDVAGVEVGHVTLVAGEGRLDVGQGPVRTGVTAILPRGRSTFDECFAAVFSLNGNGEMTGTAWIEE